MLQFRYRLGNEMEKVRSIENRLCCYGRAKAIYSIAY